MTKDQITTWARQAGMGGMITDVVCTFDELERFAALVAVAAKAEENETCEKVCEALADAALERDKGTMSDGTIQYMGDHGLYGEYQGASNCVAAIRARKIEAK